MARGPLTVRPLQEHHRRADERRDRRGGAARRAAAGARAAARVPRGRRLPPARAARGCRCDALAERLARARAATRRRAGAARSPSWRSILDGAARRRAPRRARRRSCRARARARCRRCAAPRRAARRRTRVPSGDRRGRRRRSRRCAQPVESLRGVGPKRAPSSARFGLATVEDLLYHLPFRYEDRRALHAARARCALGDEATTVGEMARVREGVAGRPRARASSRWSLRDGDGARSCSSGSTRCSTSRAASAPGQRLARPRPRRAAARRRAAPHRPSRGRRCSAPTRTPRAPAARRPGLREADGDARRRMRRIVQARGRRELADRVPSALPADVARAPAADRPRRARSATCTAAGRRPTSTALDGGALARAPLAHLRRAVLPPARAGAAAQRRRRRSRAPRSRPRRACVAGAARARCRSAPTGAQERALARDRRRPRPRRTRCAGCCRATSAAARRWSRCSPRWWSIEAGWQAALMAPTELLAEQHFDDGARRSLAPLGVEAGAADRRGQGPRAARRRSPALAERRASRSRSARTRSSRRACAFARLGLAVVDEQHRFGVLQRAALQRRGGERAARSTSW